MSDITLNQARTYTARHNLRLAERLGFGIHGTVHVVEYACKEDRAAIKAHSSPVFFNRELAVYRRLREFEVTEVMGLHVPQLLRADNDLSVIEMTIVTPPFLLDFAGAVLDVRPDFSEDIWAEWEIQKREQFGGRWNVVRAVMDTLEGWGVYLLDVSPSNIRFLNG
jgi:hypothetical protein